MTLTDKTGAEVTVRKDATEFVIVLDGKTVGLAEYTDEGDRRVFPHTQVDDEYQGRGLAGILIGEALAQTRADGLRIVPLCPAVTRYVAAHPEFADIVDHPGR